MEKSRKPKRRKKQELLLGRQPFEEGIFHWKNQETKKKKNKEIKQKLLLAAQPFREGTFQWKDQENKKKKKARTTAWWSTFLKRELFIGKIMKPRRRKTKKKNKNYCLVLNLLERGLSMERSRK